MSKPLSASVVSGEADRLMAEVIAEITDRLHAGEPVDVSEYMTRHPELTDRLRPMLAALDLLAQFSSSAGSDRSSGRSVAGGELGGTLGDFRLLREVGRGGMGIVYEAEQISLRRRVALKVLPFAATKDPRHLQRFHNEAQAAACLHHTNIVPVFFVGCERGIHCYAMQFIDGQSLSEIIHQLRRAEKPESVAAKEQTAADSLPPEGATQTSPRTRPVAEVTPLTNEGRRGPEYYRKVAELVVQAAEALDHAHQLGIVHRDIKPANLLLDARGNLWITDFGLAQVQSETRLTQTGDLVGTLRYMSPEQALAKRLVPDHRADVYSLGATLYELLTLRPAFTSEDRHELLRQIALEEPTRPSQLDRAIPSELEIIVLKAMEKRPQDRYATAQELADDLRRFRNDEPIRARRPSMVQRMRRWIRRHQSLVNTAAVFAALTGLLIVAGLLWHIHVLKAASEGERQQAEEAARQRDVAREQRRLARKAVDKMYSEVAEKWLANQPDMQQIQRQFLEEALRFYQDFARETASDPDSRAERGMAYQRVAAISWMLGQRSPALENFAHAITTFQGLTEEFPDNPEYSYELGQCYFRRAVCRGPGALEQEIEDGRRAIALFEPLASGNRGSARFPEALAKSLSNLSHPVSHFDPVQAEELRRRSVALLEKTLKDFGPRPDTLRWLSPTYEALAESQTAAGKLSEAEHYSRKAIETFHRLQINPSKGQVYGQHLRPYDWLNLGSCYRSLGNGLGRRGQHAEAQEALKQALKIHAKLAEDFPDLVIYRPDIGLDHAALGALYQRMGHASEADRAYQLARKELERMVQDFPTGWAYHYNLARFLVLCPQSRNRDPLLSIRVARKALEAMPENEQLWHVLGIGYFQLGEYRAALEALRKAKDHRVRGNSFDFYYLAMVQHQLGDRQEACKSYQEAVEWMNKNRPGDQELCQLRVEAASLLGIKERQTKNREVSSEKK